VELLCDRANDHEADSLGTGATATRELMALDLRRRRQRIGRKNILIVRLILEAPDKRINQDILLSMLQTSGEVQSAGFGEFTAEEFFYRASFLIQIRLLREERDSSGRLFYMLEEGVARHLPTE
jgi:hypothetical protein